MGRFRGWLKRLERVASEDLESFELLDGSIYYYNRLETSKELFVHACDLQLGMGDEWPEPPEVYRKMCEARNPAAILGRLKPEDHERAFVDVTQIYDTDALVHERRLVPLLSVKPPEDLSE